MRGPEDVLLGSSDEDSEERMFSRVKSEDIQILDARSQKYLQSRDEIRRVISDDSENWDACVNDVVNAISELGKNPTWWSIVSLGVIPIKNHYRRKKLKTVVETILKKIFDVSLGWYAVDYEDLRQTCDYLGGRDYFGVADHRHIYTAVMQKLKEGGIRDKCIQLEIVDFVNEKLISIRNNYMSFKMKEL